jgi:hypothetical protein
MKTVSVRSLRIVVPTKMKVTKTGNDVPVDYSTGLAVDVGRLTIDNELARMKYCV